VIKDDKDQPVMRMKWPNVQLHTARNLRELWAVTRHAKIVVSPDSMLVHVAVSLAIPCVGLWGIVSPHNRVKYYKNHLAIHNKEACPMAPCFSYLANFPKYCPPRKDRIVCECLGAVSPVQVIDAIRKIQPELAKKEAPIQTPMEPAK
jgi:ADP-heptose:LPS heptosyltransferase